MIPGLDLTEIIQAVGVFGLMAIIFAESGLLIGFFLPGDTLLFTAGLLAHEGVLGVNVHILVAALFFAAITGDSVGYLFGRRAGPKIFNKEDSILFHKDYLTRAEAFYKKYGAATIVLARFVPLVRTFAPIVAGVGSMPYRTFVTFNILGGLLWTASITYLGYYAGAWFESRGIEIDHLILPIVAFAMFITVASPLIHILKEPASRKKLLAKIGIGRKPA